MPVGEQCQSILFTFICGLDEHTFKQTVLFKLDKPSALPESLFELLTLHVLPPHQ